ncbi:MAG: zinc-binding dehydrogenase, partial [Armatimonadota bacterium]
EHTGAETWPTSIKSLTWGGTLVTCGNTTGHEAVTDLRFVFNKQLNILGCHQGSKAELVDGLRWVETGRIRPVVGEVLPLNEAARAQQMMEAGQKIGKLVLTP